MFEEGIGVERGEANLSFFFTINTLLSVCMYTMYACMYMYVLYTLCCLHGNVSHGKIGSLSSRKANYNRVALPNPN